MSTSGYSSTTRQDLLLGTAVLYRDTTTLLGVSRGPCRVEITETIRNADFNGKHSPVRGLDYVVSRALVVRCLLLEASTNTQTMSEFDYRQPMSAPGASGGFGSRSWAQQGAESWATFGAEPWGTLVDMQVGPAMALRDPTRYLQNLLVVGRHGDGTLRKVVIPYGSAKATFRSIDKSEGEWDFSFACVQEPSGSPLDLTAAPWSVQRV